METAILARRMLIIVLFAAISAMVVAALVAQTPRPTNRVHLGSMAPCYHPASTNCTPVASQS